MPIRSPKSVFSISPRGTMPGRAAPDLRDLRALSGSPRLLGAGGPYRPRSARHEEAKARRRGGRGGMRRLWRNGTSSREGNIPGTAELSRTLHGVWRQRATEQIVAGPNYGCSASLDIGTFVELRDPDLTNPTLGSLRGQILRLARAPIPTGQPDRRPDAQMRRRDA